MFCKNCGATIADNANVCPNCGTKTNTAASAAPATSLESVLNVNGDISKLLNYVTIVCMALAGFLWIYAGISVGKSNFTFAQYFEGINLAFLPVIIGQGFFASAILTFLVIKKASFISKTTATLTTAILALSSTVLTIFASVSTLDAVSADMGDMNVAGWLCIIVGLVGSVCAIANYRQSKK